MIPKTLTRILRSAIIKMKDKREIKRTETRKEVETYLAKLKYAIESDSVTIRFQKKRRVDKNRDKRHTNRYTIAKLFPDEDEVSALKRELIKLTIDEYIETVKDVRFPNNTEMRVFVFQYLNKDVYIKIRVELASAVHASGNNFILVMSFHFSEKDFNKFDFVYRKK